MEKVPEYVVIVRCQTCGRTLHSIRSSSVEMVMRATGDCATTFDSHDCPVASENKDA